MPIFSCSVSPVWRIHYNKFNNQLTSLNNLEQKLLYVELDERPSDSMPEKNKGISNKILNKINSFKL